ncbi:hypothetical protein CTP10_R19180 [Cupriavidus sp. P-10]|nr:hypothetical protein CTP10_R19180 [Cupriavidus sp. P-10]
MPDQLDILRRTRPVRGATVWLKAYCACYCTHAYIDAVRPFAARRAEIAGIQARIHPAFNVVVGTANANAYEPKNIEHVQFSLPTQMAFAVLGMGNGCKVHRDYLDGKLDMAPVLDVARGIAITEAPELEARYPGKFVADVTVTFRDGSTEHVLVEAGAACQVRAFLTSSSDKRSTTGAGVDTGASAPIHEATR